jgi:hypothetical protein
LPPSRGRADWLWQAGPLDDIVRIMGGALNRRAILGRSLAAGAALALPGKALASIAAVASSLTPYERRIFEVATRERDRAGTRLWFQDIAGVADFAQPSWRPRFHLVNFEDGTVRSYLVSHGRGSDREHDGWLKRFSGTPGSHATSRGAYVTNDWYIGKYGTSLRLLGLDPDNATALQRAIVMHQASYAEESMIARWGKLGRSLGCFAFGRDAYRDVLYSLYGGRLLFADQIGEV